MQLFSFLIIHYVRRVTWGECLFCFHFWRTSKHSSIRVNWNWFSNKIKRETPHDIIRQLLELSYSHGPDRQPSAQCSREVPQILLFESRRYSYSLLREKERKIDHSVFCPWFICIKMNNANFEKERMCKSFIRSIERTCRTIVIITSKIDDNVRRASLFDLQRNVNKPNIECFTNNSSCSILLNLFGMTAQGPC